MKTPLSDISANQLRRAIAIKERIEALQMQLDNLFGALAPAAAPVVPKKRRMSAAGRARIAAVQRARWAKQKKAQGLATKPARKRRGKLSPEGRARIVAAQKARWAKAKAQQGK
jgi:hypothetical protein